MYILCLYVIIGLINIIIFDYVYTDVVRNIRDFLDYFDQLQMIANIEFELYMEYRTFSCKI